MRTVYNQYDSMVRPLRKWLDGHGVQFRTNTRVVDLRYDESHELNRVVGILCEHENRRVEITGDEDAVTIAGYDETGLAHAPFDFHRGSQNRASKLRAARLILCRAAGDQQGLGKLLG